VAIEIARMLGVCFICANYNASLLRDNFDIHFWCKVLMFLRRLIQENISKYGGHPYDLISQNRPGQFWRMATPSEDVVPYCQSQCYSHEKVPDIRIQDVLYGNIKFHGKFESYHGGLRFHITIAMFSLVRFGRKKNCSYQAEAIY
jgi:hypothetical protein